MFKKKLEKEPVSNGMAPLNTADEELFEALGKSKKAKKRKVIRRVLILVILLAVVLIVGVGILQRKVRSQFASSGAEVLSAQAERGTVSTVVSGSGVLVNVDTEVISVPSGVEITKVLVEFGDSVQEGDLLAVADMATVRTAMSQLQTEIEDLDDRITAAEGDTVSSYLSAGVPGRVKVLHVCVDTPVEDAMVEYGSLAEISLDGFMAVDLETDALTEGEKVTVILSGGTEEEGTVESVVGTKATVLVTDNGPESDEEVTVVSEEGTRIGSGKLYIHNPLRVTGYAGTVSAVNVSLNQKVYASTTLFTLKDTSTSASYDALLRSRRESEETLLELLRIQRFGGLTAPISGSVLTVIDLDSEDAQDLADEAEIVTLSPDVSMSVTISVDEGDILSLELGQDAEVTVNSVSDETFSGRVTEIDKTDSTGSYTAVITLDKVEGMLPGMTASVDVRIEGVDNAILIPTDALHQTRTGYYVYTSYDEQSQEYGGRTDVVPGLSNDDYVEIKSGLKEGDTVYYTESTEPFGSGGFGNMPNGGGMPNGGMPGGGSGTYGNGGRGGSGMPSGGVPGGGNMPSGRG